MQQPTWFQWAQRIQAIAQTGLTYGRDPYDLERYAELRSIAAEILSAHTTATPDQWGAALAPERGYPTPKVDIRAVVFDAEERILLVRERAEGLWSLPGGWADAGATPGEMAAREVQEESGYLVRPVKVLAVYDRARHPHPPLLWPCYKLFIRCELVGGQAAHSLETDGVGFFAATDLPPLSVGRVTEQQLDRLFEHYRQPDLPTDFD
ncbi:MAG: NUDIX hydrolase [Bacillota bacterium]